MYLGDRGRRVVLLEFGGDVAVAQSIEQSAHLNEGVAEELPFNGLQRGRARVLGGTTQLWDGECMRLHEIDLRPREWIPGSGWPISLSDLDRYYILAENWLELSGRGYSGDRWLSHPKLPVLGWDREYLVHGFTEYSPRPYLGSRFRESIARHPNIFGILNATVTAIKVAAGRACGVEVACTAGRRETIDASVIALAAGTIENTRLLQLSDPEGVGLGWGRSHTGKFLQDHPIIRTGEVFPRDYRVLQDRYAELHQHGRRLFPKVLLSPSAQQRYQLLDAAAVFEHEYDDHALDAARRLLRALRRRERPTHGLHDALIASRAAIPVAQGLYRRYIRGLSYTGVKPRHIWLQVWVEQAPRPDRYIKLGDTRDALGQRQAVVRWSCEQSEIDTSRRLTRWIAGELKRLGVATVTEAPSMTDDVAWRSSVRDAFHPAGTTRMARGPEDGVVDADLQVFGVEGLFVVGGSVFPASGYGNPTLTIVALAHRLAEHLSKVRVGADAI